MNRSLKKYVAGISLLGLMAAPIAPASIFAEEITTKNVEGVSVDQAKLTQEQKKAYYKQYVKIIEEVVAEHEGVSMEAVPFDEFAEGDWVEPEEFRKRAIERANLTFVDSQESNPSSGPITLAGISKTKSKNFDADGTIVTLNVTGNFETGYNGNIDSQVFTGINSITSRTTSGSWTQTGYDPERIDGGRTYGITVGGRLDLSGIKSNHRVYIEFYCSKSGAIS
ncbi:hypothetical protein [Aneurinibacillus aneurinilyticus]|jgi:hypothetical protein|uniref:hypothetical protein n=1 Tax=Aneurinibacillus aneurinilyticus TaxID=1391 RepID=UPI0023F0C1B3|nr:hypothetical protein [Aneurinibacillus aneurinilyticus]MCI1696033.1 hypothetical protein [Aneurinibacillus aneurinilyticus]